MPDPTITNVNTSSVAMEGAAYRDGLLTFAGAATVLEGTILARDSVSLKYVPYAIGGVTNENGIPKAIQSAGNVVAAGAGDEPVRPLIEGRVRKELLIVDADGDGSNITEAILDQLREYGIVALDVQELQIQDNQ